MTDNPSKVAVLRQRQSLPLEAKVAMTIKRIREWYEHWDGDVYVSYSGGRDSSVLLDLVWSIYPDVPAVFSNTGLEMREIKEFVTFTEKRGLTSIVDGKRVYRRGPVERVRPAKSFNKVVEEDGFALVSKKWSKAIRVVKENSPDTANVRRLHLEGVNRHGEKVTGWTIPKRWRHLIDADISISEKCCDHLKKEPLKTYEKKTGLRPITGMMGGESEHRKFSMTECNAFKSRRPMSSPMMFWTTEDVEEYINSRRLRVSTAYKWVRNELGEWVEPEERTGCAFCMFGVHLEKGANRFQRLYKRDKRMWDTAINKLGLSKPLDLIDVKYIPEGEQDNAKS